MFTQTWKKYLPVILILMKKSTQEEQVLKVNQTDFDRAAGGRKIKFSFNHVELKKGRLNSHAKHSPFAKEFATIMQEDEMTRGLLSQRWFEFSMSTDFQLTIKQHPLEAEPTQDESEQNNEIALAE
jgi:predicted GNAT superfamily acetyltransferase